MNFYWLTVPALWGWLVFLFDLALRLWFGVRIVRRRLPASVAWAWLSLILFLPLFGTFIYINFGEYRQSRRRQRRLRVAQETIDRIADNMMIPTSEPVGGAQASLVKAFADMMGLPALQGNEISLLANAEAAFGALLADVKGARETIDLEFYIWSDGGRANAFAQELAEAARRGVKCRLLVDAVGSSQFLRGEWRRSLESNGVKVVAALPSGILRSMIARPDLRIHRKIAVIDGAIGYTGSMNLADPEFFKRDEGVGPWVDAMGRLRGPAVAALYGVFLSDWCAETGEEIIFDAARVRAEVVGLTQSAPIQCLPSGPAIKYSAIEQALIMTLYAAQSEIILTTPYFVPSEALLYALTGAVRRGVRTTLIVPENVDSRITHHASRSFLEDLVHAGVTVALYRPGLLHTKSVTIDRQFSLFGSLNLDARSLRINFEITIAVFDSDFTRTLCTLQAAYLRDSWLYTDADIMKRTRLENWKGDLARLVGPLL